MAGLRPAMYVSAQVIHGAIREMAKGKASGRRGGVAVWWLAAMAAGGVAFGLLGDRRPFGEGLLFHPLTILFVIATAMLLALRFASRRPVPEIIPDRALAMGCVLGLGCYLLGNFAASHLLR